jgi:hypothetical protein
MRVVFFVGFFGWVWGHGFRRWARAALLPGIVSWRTVPTGIAGRRDRFRSRDGEIIHTSLRSFPATASVRSMIVVITTRK